MKFSITIPTLNQGRYIDECIQSILDQVVDASVEILVCDGGSTDNTFEVLEKHRDRVRVISRRDQGQTDAINKGLKRSSGDIYAYLNSDDIYYPGALARVLRHFQDNEQSEILYGKAYHLNEDGTPMESYYTEQWDYDRLHHLCYLCQPAVFWKRSLTEKIGFFDNSLNFCMDYEYWLRAGKVAEFSYIEDSYLAGSRLHDETKTLSKRVDAHVEAAKMIYHTYSHSEGATTWLKHAAHYYVNEQIPEHSTDIPFHIIHRLRIAEEIGMEISKSELIESYGLLKKYIKNRS